MSKVEKDLYKGYEAKKYVHYRLIETGKFEVEDFKSAKSGKRVRPILKEVKISFEEVKSLRLDSMSPAVPMSDTEDFTMISNYMIDFWGAVIGSEPVSVYMHLRRYAYGKKDYCFPDIELIAQKMNKSINSIKKYMSVLEEYGFIAKILRRDVTQNNREVSPLFKIRRYVPMITKEMYDNLPDKLKALHDDFLKNLDGVSFANNIMRTNDALKPIIDNGIEINNKEIEEKIEKIIEIGKMEEFVLNSVSDEVRVLNEDFHSYFMSKISKPSYETWLKNSVLIVEKDNIVLLIQNDFALDWVNNHYLEMIQDWAKKHSLHHLEIKTELINDYVKTNFGRGA